MKIDLHMHTTYSDGCLSVEEILRLVSRWEYDVVSITDHDNVDSYAKASALAPKYGVEVIPGVEVSTLYKGTDIHILGYYVDTKSAELLKFLDSIRNSRHNRAKDMLERLNQLGMPLTIEDVMAHTGQADVVGRPHIAAAMVKKGYCSSFADAFNRFIGDNGPAYLPKPAVGPDIAVQVIKAAGGVPVLAHPYKTKMENLVEEMVDCGIMGLETYYALHGPEQIAELEAKAKRYGLISTGGSDNHGFPEALNAYGYYSAPDKCYKQLKEARMSL